MAKRRERNDAPDWPAHLAEYHSEDGWESKLDWEIARTKWARSHGFTQYKMLPLMQRIVGKEQQTDDR